MSLAALLDTESAGCLKRGLCMTSGVLVANDSEDPEEAELCSLDSADMEGVDGIRVSSG